MAEQKKKCVEPQLTGEKNVFLKCNKTSMQIRPKEKNMGREVEYNTRKMLVSQCFEYSLSNNVGLTSTQLIWLNWTPIIISCWY